MSSIGVFGAKGGVGTSLVCTNLALALSRTGSCLLIDLNPVIGCDDLLLDLQAKRSWLDLLPVTGELKRTHLDRACAVHPTGLQCLTAPGMQPEESGWKKLQLLIAEMDRFYRWILFDLPVHSGRSYLEGLLAAPGYRLLVSTPDPAALRAAKRMLDDPGVRIRSRTGLVLNQISTRHPASAQTVASSLGIELLGVTPTDPRSIGYQVNFGKACVEDRRSPFGRAVLRLAERLNRIPFEPKSTQPKPEVYLEDGG